MFIFNDIRAPAQVNLYEHCTEFLYVFGFSWSVSNEAAATLMSEISGFAIGS
ncbi:hypothetical protein [Cytobacillus firmus]